MPAPIRIPLVNHLSGERPLYTNSTSSVRITHGTANVRLGIKQLSGEGGVLTGAEAILSPTTARELAADLIARADAIEGAR